MFPCISMHWYHKQQPIICSPCLLFVSSPFTVVSTLNMKAYQGVNQASDSVMHLLVAQLQLHTFTCCVWALFATWLPFMDPNISTINPMCASKFFIFFIQRFVYSSITTNSFFPLSALLRIHIQFSSLLNSSGP